MNNGLKFVLTFSIGVVTGSIVTWKLLDKRYKRLLLDELQHEKEVYLQQKRALDGYVEEDEDEEDDSEPIPAVTEADIRDYHNKVGTLGYTNYSSCYGGGNNAASEKATNRPYVISPDEFDELDDYEAISLTYYEGDGVLTDDMDCPVENVDDVVGYDSLRHFGEYEEDSVFVRNDEMKADYEILLDVRKYSDVVSINPHSAEDE